MLGPCFPVAQAAFSAVVKPFHHLVHYVLRAGIGHHAALHPAGAAIPHASSISMACAQAPGGLLPAGPIPGALSPAYASNVGDAGNGAAFGPASAGGSGAAAPGVGGLGGGLSGLGSFGAGSSGLGSVGVGSVGAGSLAGTAGFLAGAALLAGGLAMAALTAAPTASEQSTAQQAATADMAHPLPFIAAPLLAALAIAAPTTAMALLPGNAQDTSTPATVTLGAAAPGAASVSGATASGAAPASSQVGVPEPASLTLLGAGLAVTWAVRRRTIRRR